MKVTFDIDCTPQEARAFFGLPDLTPVHDLYVERMKALVTDGLTPADFEKATKAWMPNMAEGLEQWRNAMWSAATGSTTKE
jgi:hypothetical protein